MKRVFFYGLMLVFLGALPAQAMPGMGAGSAKAAAPGDKFASADTGKDGYCSREEFAKAFAGLKPEAFDLIDKDKDGRISRDEWKAFSSRHGGHASGQAPAQSPGQLPGQSPSQPLKKDETLPVVPAPSGPDAQGNGK